MAVAILVGLIMIDILREKCGYKPMRYKLFFIGILGTILILAAAKVWDTKQEQKQDTFIIYPAHEQEPNTTR